MKALSSKAFNFDLESVETKIKRANLIPIQQPPSEQKNYIVYKSGEGSTQFSVGCDKMTKELFQRFRQVGGKASRLVGRSLPKIKQKPETISSRQCKRMSFVRTRSPILKRQLQSLSPSRIEIKFTDRDHQQMNESSLPFYWTELTKIKKETKEQSKNLQNSEQLLAQGPSTDRTISQSKFTRKRMKKLVPFTPKIQTLADHF